MSSCHLYLNLHLFIGIGIFLELQQYFVNYSPPMTMLKHYKHVQKHKELVTLKMNKIFTFIKTTTIQNFQAKKNTINS